MPISVRLDPKTESLVKRLAKRKGASKSAVIRAALAALSRSEGEGQETARPYEMIAHLLGCARGGPKDLSERTGQKLREFLRARARE
jgi:hypothetical protein